MARSVSSQALPLVNIPAHSDVKRISRRLGAIENRQAAKICAPAILEWIGRH
jgi:hypothetical protein